MVDVERILKNVMNEGKVNLGIKQTKLSIKNKAAKIVIMAKNCPFAEEINALGKESDIPIYTTDLTSVNLGYTCGKNYSVSVFAVLDDGNTNVMQLVKKRK